MEIEIKYLLGGAKEGTGLAVVIDIFRASTTIATLLSRGAEKIIPVSELEETHKLKRENLDFILVGERNGLKPDGFDYENSPTELQDAYLNSKTVIMTTANGTRAIDYARNADEIIIGSFVNCDGVVNYIKDKNPNKVSLLAVGSSDVRTPKDDIFADYLKARLENKRYDLSNLREKVIKSRTVEILTKAGKLDDVDYCLQLNLHYVVPKVFKENNMLVIKNAL